MQTKQVALDLSYLERQNKKKSNVFDQKISHISTFVIEALLFAVSFENNQTICVTCMRVMIFKY